MLALPVDVIIWPACRYFTLNCPGRNGGSSNTAAAQGNSVSLATIQFTVNSAASTQLYTGALFVGRNSAYSNTANLVLTTDSSLGANIATSFTAQVCAPMRLGLLPVTMIM